MRLEELDFDQAKMKDGVWHKDPLFSDVEYLVFATNSTRFRAYTSGQGKRMRDAKSDEERTELICDWTAGGILGGWKGIDDVPGPYNYESALKIARNQRVREMLNEWANDQALYLQEEEAELGEG